MSGNLWWSASKAIKPILRKNPDTLSAASREAVQLFRLMAKEVPRISNLYDVPMPNNVIRRRLANAFRKNADVKDPRVVHLMVRDIFKLQSFFFFFASRKAVSAMMKEIINHHLSTETMMYKNLSNA